MKPSAFLAFDLGASGGRGILGELHGGKLSLREVSRFPNGMLSVRGHLHWNIFNLFERIKEGIHICARERVPDSVGIDTWGVDFGLLARDGCILGLPFAYRDSRTDGAMESFFKKVPQKRVYELTGIQFLPLNTLFQLESMVRDTSPLLELATDLLFIPDLLNYLLSGAKKTEFTFASTSQLYNPIKGGWENELLAALGLPLSLMQEIVPPGSVIGAISHDVSQEIGIPELPVIAVATHDTGSAVAAAPAEGDDWAYISSGTWSLMGIETKAPIITSESMRLNFTNEGGVGRTFRFLKNIAGLWLLQECRRAWDQDKSLSYDDLLESAQTARPFSALIDPDWPEFLNPPDMPEAIRAACKRTAQEPPASRGEFVRCILESLALKYRFVLDQLRRISPLPINRIHVIGGGARNRLLCQFTADATGIPIFAGPVEATAIGNIMVQALSYGRVSSLAEMRDVIRRSFDVVTYLPDQTTQWNRAYERFYDVLGNAGDRP
ncbi:MAG: rhamnulokinase family protein [Candidatus Abyssubacteria bacterium]